MGVNLVPLGILSVEAVAMAGLVVALFSARRWLGIAPLCLSLGVLQQWQAITAQSFYVEAMPGLPVSPGTAVFFTANLFAILLVYLREDEREAGKLALGLAFANVFSALMVAVLRFQVGASGGELPPDWLTGSIPHLLVGGALLLLDSLLMVGIYRGLGGVLRSPFVRACLALNGALALDSLLFAAALLRDLPDFPLLFGAMVAAKAIFAAIFAAALALYLRFSHPGKAASGPLTYREKYELVRRELRRDALTGLFNRGYLDQYLPDAIARAQLEERPLALLLVDLDHFKAINDRHGHAVGDAVLRRTAELLSSRLRPSDRVFRYGGEEFAIVLTDTGPQDARMVAERVRAMLDLPLGFEDLPVSLSATIGAAMMPQDGDTAEALFAAADARLYVGKREGRNRVVSAHRPVVVEHPVMRALQGKAGGRGLAAPA